MGLFGYARDLSCCWGMICCSAVGVEGRADGRVDVNVSVAPLRAHRLQEVRKHSRSATSRDPRREHLPLGWTPRLVGRTLPRQRPIRRQPPLRAPGKGGKWHGIALEEGALAAIRTKNISPCNTSA
jgi:hypothetical protein